MSRVDEAFVAISELKIWFNQQAGAPLTLADMSELLAMRWNYFKDNWEFIIDSLKERIPTYTYPDLLQFQINKLNDLIILQRHDTNRRTNPFAKPSVITDYYAVWENIEVASIPVTKDEQKIIDDKINRIIRFTTTDFINIRAKIMAGRDEIADIVGLSDPDYNTTFDRSSIATLRDARIKDVTDMQTMQQGLLTLDFILANTGFLQTVSIDPFALARANANNPDVDIQTGLSGQLVRMFFGDSLQSLAARYLGSADRWLEIAIANGLKPPYIDEIGETISLISNGSDSQINLPKTDINGNLNKEKLYVNQVIFLQSNTIKFPDQRTILSIREIPISGELVIEVSGTSNMNQYTTLDNAHIRVFKPNTMNSNFLVMIPSTDPTPRDPKETPFFLASKGEDEKKAGVDLLIDDAGDLVFSSTGDLQLSYGLANAMQAMKLKLLTEQGQNSRHALYGLPAIQGIKTNDPGVIREVLVNNINTQVQNDSRFARVETIDVAVRSGSAIISLVVRMAGTGSLLPLNFTVNTG